jgi:SAM-dependent methyltransferase
MKPTVKARALNSVNSLLGATPLELVRRGKGFKYYLPLQSTVQAAEKAGVPLGDFIDNAYNVPGATQQTIDQMARLGVFSQGLQRVCEIGPGSGRYLDKTLQACQPAYYEIYETATDWRNWLAHKYPVTAHPADGVSLSATPSGSIDLVHSHKVFAGLPFLTTIKYFSEMARVVRPGGAIVFDIVTEECFNGQVTDNWLSSNVDWANSMIPRQFAIKFFAARGCSLVGSFLIPMKPGVTEYLIFRSPGPTSP